MLTIITTGAYSDKHVVGLVETDEPIAPAQLQELLQEFYKALGITNDFVYLDSEEMTETLIALGLHDPDRGYAWVANNGEDYFIEWLVKHKTGFRKVAYAQIHI